MVRKIEKNIANFITGIRIFGSIVMAFVPVFTVTFYGVYLICGLSDMVDGAVARKTNGNSRFGARLDTAADFLFAVTAFCKLLPRLLIPRWLWLWIAVIAVIKAANVVLGFIRCKKLVSVHSVMNKIIGFLLFLFPLTLTIIELKYSAVVVCFVATFSAIQEGYYIGTDRALVM